MDLYFDYDASNRDELYAKFVELRDQLESGLSQVTVTNGTGVSYISRNDAFLQLRTIGAKLEDIDGKDYGFRLGVKSYRAVARKGYAWRLR